MVTLGDVRQCVDQSLATNLLLIFNKKPCRQKLYTEW